MQMDDLRTLRLKTNCHLCTQKCCSQPYDWVYLTSKEISRLETASGLAEHEFVVRRQNKTTRHVFRTLELPCRFFDPETGRCGVYESRPLVCRIFPFYPEPLTGDATLLPVQCGNNLHFLPTDSQEGWQLSDSEQSVREWLFELWDEAISQSTPEGETSIARAAGSP